MLGRVPTQDTYKPVLISKHGVAASKGGDKRKDRKAVPAEDVYGVIMAHLTD